MIFQKLIECYLNDEVIQLIARSANFELPASTLLPPGERKTINFQ